MDRLAHCPPARKLVTINTQLQRNRERDVRQVFQTVEHLLAHTSVSILLHGRGSLPAEVKKRYADRLHFAASGPLKSALIRRDKSAAEYIGLFIDGLGLALHILAQFARGGRMQYNEDAGWRSAARRHMPSLDFKGKQLVYTHHLTVPFRELVVDAKKSLPAKGKPSMDDNLIIHGDNLHALKALLRGTRGR